jgi:hypothetical protein
MNGFSVYKKLEDIGYKEDYIRQLRFIKHNGYWYVVKHNHVEWADDIKVIENHDTIEIFKDE